MRYYYDFEFLEGTQDKTFLGIKYGQTKPTIDVISVGIVSEDGREYYAISKDFNLKEAWNRSDLNARHGDQRNLPPTKVYWIRENVLKPVWLQLCKVFHEDCDEDWIDPKYRRDVPFTYKTLKYLLKDYGKSNQQIAEEVEDFIRSGTIGLEFQFVPPEFYGYYSAYDHVALCWLFGKMNDLPKGFPMYTIDLKQMIAGKAIYFEREDFFTAFDFKGEGLSALTLDEKIQHLKMHVRYPKQENEHDVLADARYNKKLHEFILSL